MSFNALESLYSVWIMVINVVRLLRLLFAVRFHSIRYTGKSWSVADLFEEQVRKDPSRVQFVCAEDGRSMTLGEADTIANQVAHWGMSTGLHLSSTDTVALMMENSPEYSCFWYGMAKIGVVTALINTGSVGIALVHSVVTALKDNEGVRYLVISRSLCDAGCLDAAVMAEFSRNDVEVVVWEDLYTPAPEQYGAITREIGGVSTAAKTAPPRSVRAHVLESDVLMYIYTSGTTGLPKASRISHTRYYVASSPFRIMCALTESDRIYTPLPLYHSSAVMLGVGGAIISGACMVIRRKFSVKAFTEDCLKHNITAVQYIGELCRYLKDAPPNEHDALLDMRVAFGNGLRADVWQPFKERYGFRHVCEFYAATESNIASFALDRVGSCGFVPRFANMIYPVRIVRTDPSNPGVPLRNPETGWCMLCGPDEAGLVLGEINDKRADRRFDGYTDTKASEGKVVRGVFKDGDRYFNTSDCLSQDRLGYFYFQDRTGDTFRWKGENISASEVEKAVMLLDCVADVAVFGVEIPGHDGRAGMAAVVLKQQELEGGDGGVGTPTGSRSNNKKKKKKKAVTGDQKGGKVNNTTTTTTSSSSSSSSSSSRSFTQDQWADFRAVCRAHLPPAARPAFVRFTRSIPKTETFKHQKAALKEAGFVPVGKAMAWTSNKKDTTEEEEEEEEEEEDVYLCAGKRGNENPLEQPLRIDRKLLATLELGSSGSLL